MLQGMLRQFWNKRKGQLRYTDYEKDMRDVISKEMKGEISLSSFITIESILMNGGTEGYSTWVQELLIFRFFFKIKGRKI